jgi:hypothetical protein
MLTRIKVMFEAELAKKASSPSEESSIVEDRTVAELLPAEPNSVSRLLEVHKTFLISEQKLEVIKPVSGLKANEA